MHSRSYGFLLLMTISLASCATTRQAVSPVEGRGDEFLADSISMTGNPNTWGGGMQLARFTAGVEHEGARCVEVTIPYGETAVAWTFAGLGSEVSAEIVLSVNVDFFGKETYLYVACMPGHRDAREMGEPRDSFRSFQSQGWADGSAEWPDSTDGWRTIRCRGSKADEKGDITVVMIFGHPNENPPLVFGYITNPVVNVMGES